MSFIETAILSSFEMLMLIIIAHGIVRFEKSKVLQKMLFVIVPTILIAFVSTLAIPESIDHILARLIAYVNAILYLKIYSNKKIIFSTMYFFIASTLIITIQVLSVIILNIIFHNFEYTFFYGIISQCLSIVICILFARKKYITHFINYFDKGHYRSKVILSSIYMAYFAITTLWSVDTHQFFELLLSVVIIMILTAVAIVMLIKENVLVKAYEEKLTFYDTYLKIIDDVIDELRGYQHDYHNHLQTLVAMSNNDEQIEEYVGNLGQREVWKKLLTLDNKIMTAFFYSKHKQALEKNISINYQLAGGNFDTQYEIYDIIEMYGILIDNAIEACKQGDKIEIRLDFNAKKSIFKITNPSEFISADAITKFFSKNHSTKDSKNRGIGLYKLKEKLLKSDDQLYFSYNNQINSIVAELEHS